MGKSRSRRSNRKHAKPIVTAITYGQRAKQKKYFVAGQHDRW